MWDSYGWYVIFTLLLGQKCVYFQSGLYSSLIVWLFLCIVFIVFVLFLIYVNLILWGRAFHIIREAFLPKDVDFF